VIISASDVGVIMLAKKYISFKLMPVVFYPIVCSVIIGSVLYIFGRVFVNNLVMALVMVVLGTIIYFGSMYLLAWKQLREDVAMVVGNLRR